MNFPIKNLKYLIFPIAGLVILHLGLVYSQRKQTLKLLKTRTLQVQNQIGSLESRKAMVSKRLKLYIVIYRDLKPWLSAGFGDPEKGLTKFLDYLNSLILDKVNAMVNIQTSNISKRQPIPLQQSSFVIDFDFLYIHEVGNFLKTIFLQDQYPIRVQLVRIQRQKDRRTTGKLDFDLLIPANLKQLQLNEFEACL